MNTQAFSIVSRYMATPDIRRLIKSCRSLCTGFIMFGHEGAPKPMHTIYKLPDGSAVTVSHTGRVRMTTTVQEAESLIIEEEDLTLKPQELH